MTLNNLKKTAKKYLFSKRVIIIAASALIILFSRMVPQLSLSDRAIVVSLAIDEGENGGFQVSTEIIVSSSTSGSSDGSKSEGYLIVSGNGGTIIDALNDIECQSGLRVSIAHCNVVLIGEKVFDDLGFPEFSYIVKDLKLSEDSVVVGTKGRAVEIQRAKTILGMNSGFEIQRALLANGEDASIVISRLKDIIYGVNSLSSTGYSTMVELVRDDPQNIGDPSSKGNENEFFKYMYDKTVVFGFGGGGTVVLDENMTRVVSILSGNVKKGILVVENDGKSYNLQIVGLNNKTDFKLNGNNVDVWQGISIDCKLNEIEGQKKNELTDKNVDEQTLKRIGEIAAEKIKTDTVQTFKTCAGEGFDIFHFADRLFSRFGNEWKTTYDQNSENGKYLDLIRFSADVSVNISKS